MEPSQWAAATESPQEVVAKIEQKALRLSALLREIGVFLMQGFAISPPLGVKELAEWASAPGRARAV